MRFFVDAISTAFTVYYWLIIIRIIFSWIPVSGTGIVEQIRNFVHDTTEPYLQLFRRALPMVNLGGMGLDLSPLIGLIVLGIIHRLLISVLQQILV
ncbi:MAG: YggT family protein [Actinomycetia bacterium]|nr:YggT family protein [Actinomycetes bacterium]